MHFNRWLWWGSVPSLEQFERMKATADRVWVNEALVVDEGGDVPGLIESLARALDDRMGVGVAVNGSNVWSAVHNPYWPYQQALRSWCSQNGALLQAADGDFISNWPGTYCFDPTHPGLVGAYLDLIVKPLFGHRHRPPRGWSSWFVDQVEGELMFRSWWTRSGEIPLYGFSTRRSLRPLDEAASLYEQGERLLLRRIAQLVQKPVVSNGTVGCLPSTRGRFQERVLEGIQDTRIWTPQYPAVTFRHLLEDLYAEPRPGDGQGMVGTVWWGDPQGPLWEAFLRLSWGLAIMFRTGLHIRRGAKYEIPLMTDSPFPEINDPSIEPWSPEAISLLAPAGGAPAETAATVLLPAGLLVVNLDPQEHILGVGPMDARIVSV